jgi:hypothetical protein
MRKPQTFLLLAVAVATGAIFLACIGPGLGPRDCAGFIVSMNKRAVRRVAPNTSNFDMVGVPYAKIELLSTQMEFDCPNASSAGRRVYITDQEGAIKGSIGQSVEDTFRLTVTAEGCQPLVYDGANVRLMGQGDFILNCDSPPSLTSPSPTPPAECKTIESEANWRIGVNGETFGGFALIAQIDISSVQNTFACGDGYPLQALSFTTDTFGAVRKDKISGHTEDRVRVRINAPHCVPFEEELPLATLLASKQTYFIACDLSQLTPHPTRPFPALTPSPTPQ